MTVALVTGATGQDGSYLCERLAAEGADVHAVVEDARTAEGLPWLARATLHQLDLRDVDSLRALLPAVDPDEVYNLAGLSSVARSWSEPVLTAQVNALAPAALLDAAQQLQDARGRAVRFVQASSAEIFGNPGASPQDEHTPVAPTNPYGAAKAYAHHLVGVHRTRGLHACSVVLYNHESPRRPEAFVTRKITAAAARIARGSDETLRLGTLDPRRDWGWAPDYVAGMVLAARHSEPLDVVLATGVTHTIGDLVDAAFEAAGVSGGRDRVELDAAFARPTDATEQRGDATRARTELGWQTTVDFREVVARMVEADLTD